MTLAFLAVLTGCSGAAASGDAEPSAPPTPESAETAVTTDVQPASDAGIYREDQAERGRQVFRESCAECHYSSEMRDAQFQFQWERRTVGDLYEHLVKTMPEDAPGSLAPAAYLEVVAYILRLNGFPSGETELQAGEPAFATSLAAPSGAL